ncbi:MAG: Fic family protein [bacterium]|nr:Fic family protein [bacterium]
MFKATSVQVRKVLLCGLLFRRSRSETVAESLAIVHAELVLIHPFREGNGRLARLLAMLMGLQAGLPMLVFDQMEGERREAYLAAVRAGMARVVTL